MNTLILGLGNPLRGDDGVGWRAAEECAKQIADASHIEVDCFAYGGLSLMERLIGYDRVILIDAINMGHKPAGQVESFRLEELADPYAGHLASVHDVTLHTALALGRALGARLPSDVIVVATEVENVYDFTEELSPVVAQAVPRAVELVMCQLVKQPEDHTVATHRRVDPVTL
jgi:hydrogenase maturation protease